MRHYPVSPRGVDAAVPWLLFALGPTALVFLFGLDAWRTLWRKLKGKWFRWRHVR